MLDSCKLKKERKQQSRWNKKGNKKLWNGDGVARESHIEKMPLGVKS